MIVSVITSVYNCECYIEDMINSILNQSFQNWEMIIIDDASTDNTWKLIENYKDSRIIKFRNRENRGLTYNLNRAISCAKGKYILRIDGDDIAYPERFEKQVQYMEKHPEVVLSGCWMKSIGMEKRIYKSCLNEEMIKVSLLFNNAIFHPTFIIRKSILDDFNIKYNEELRYSQDYDIETRLIKYGKVTNIPEILMYYRLHNMQISQFKKKDQGRCANLTRKKMLNEMDVFLNNDEIDLWMDFSALNYRILKTEEISILKKICEIIIERNNERQIYQSGMLKKMLLERLVNYLDMCTKKGEIKNNVKIVDKYHSLFLMMCQWMHLRQSGKMLASYLCQRNINNIAIYGLGEIGKLLLDELNESSIRIKYGIDRNKEISFYENRIDIFEPESNLKKVDAIIVTAIFDYEEIKANLSLKVSSPIISLSDIIYDMI